MGNCVCQASFGHDDAAPWTGGDDDEAAPAAERRESCGGEERAGVEVTIRISKRRLQKLMAAQAAGGAAEGTTTVEKVLAEIVGAGEVVDGRHPRRWEPALRSIPEAVVES